MHDDAKALLARVGGNGKSAIAGRSPGALRVAAAVTGSLKKSAFSAGITVGAGTFAVKGQISDAGTEQMSGGVALSGQHPNLASAVRIFAPDYRPALAEPGPLKFSTDLAFDPTTLRIDNLRGNAGPVAFESNASVALDRTRPRIAGELKTSEIIVDWFLPVQKRAVPGVASSDAPRRAGGQPARRPAGGARWSNERLDFSALREVDGDIAFSAPALTYTDLKVDKPKVTLRLTDGVLDLSELSGRAYGGDFNMTGQVVASDVPSLRYSENPVYCIFPHVYRDSTKAFLEGFPGNSKRIPRASASPSVPSAMRARSIRPSTSGNAPTGVPSTGVPQAKASTVTNPNPSICWVGMTTRSAA